MSSGSSIRFGELPSSFDFVKNEQNILKFWKDIDAFQTSLKQSQGKPKYTFYDGPPFATGLPHYGHILAGTIKDTVTRYAHQRGYHVDRYFGWDCHGLPVEHEIDKKLNIKGPTDVMNMGIANYNNECRSIVNRYSSEWRHIVTRLGRWIDFDNDYKTMYPTFMESVWWVCKQIFDKNMIYYGYRVMPFSTKCNTPLSNFEANQNYKDVIDPSVVVCFPLVDDPSVSFLAWTTTPWTLISTMVLTVNPKSIYAKIKEKKTGNVYILMESRINEYFSKKPYEIIEKFPGESLKGTAFVPCFEYFRDWSNEGAFKVLTDYFVSETDGTGVVQCAPAFGEDDYRVCIKHGVCRGGSQVPCPIDETGSFTDKIPEYKGMYFKDADKHILKELKSRKRIFLDSTIKHNYPFCWRSDTPLMYRIVPSWFVKVKEIVPKLLANNKETYWVPEYVKDKRFHNWLESARDWNISRNRFWGTPIPLWVDKDFEEIVCVGSIEELYELSGVKVEDLHREHIDNIKIPSKKNPGTYLSRVSEVFDCWFESGSMPYAQVHYPFKNKNDFEKSFPADFIAEGIDQTRGWFYTLMVISTILFDKPPFKNLIVNGLVLASDGQKMSKRKQNYPDPLEVVNKYGADALRLYLINSPVVRGDCLKFKECGVQNLLKELFIIYYNAFRYLIQNIHIMEKTNDSKFVFNESQLDNVTNIMDKWILSYSQSVINFVHEEMKAYRLYTVVPAIIKFLESLSKWYIRFNKIRFKGDLGVEEQLMSLSTLYLVQYKMSITFSPFIPFMTEYIYQNLLEFKPKATSELEIELEKSVHFQMLPEPRLELIDQRVEKCVQDMQTVVDLARLIRERNVLPIKNPLREIIVITNDEESLGNIRTLEKYILEDLNIYKLTTSNDLKSYGVTCSILPDFQSLGRKFKSQMKSITEELKNLTFDDFNKTKTESGHITLCEQEIHETDLRFVYNVTGGGDYSAHSSGKFVVLLDLTQDETLKDDLVARELCNRFQKLRKKAHVVPTDNITLTCWGDENCRKVLEKHLDYITSVVKKPIIITNDHSQMPTKIIEVTEKVNDMELKLVLFLKN